MSEWAEVSDLYAFWPELANSVSFTPAMLETHLLIAEQDLRGRLETLAFDVDALISDRSLLKLKELTCYNALSNVLAFPLSGNPNPLQGSRGAEMMLQKYEEGLQKIAFNPRLIDGVRNMPTGPITKI